MTERERQWFDQMLADRIEMILELSEFKTEVGQDELKKAETIIRKLSEEDKNCLQAHIDSFARQFSRQGELLYKTGICDGIRIMSWVRSL